ncbi:MAG: hypothetical protein KHY83_06815, partial [Coriobacteriia bacterium]|nr:hypothetical protein [Coriobacteriia bacterium]
MSEIDTKESACQRPGETPVDDEPIVWVPGREYREIVYETCGGIAKITINRPWHRNAFTPLTVDEMYDAFTRARDDASI